MRPWWVMTVVWSLACAAATALHLWLHLPVLALLVDGAVLLAVWSLLERQGWPLPARFIVSLAAGLLAGLALWRG